MANAPAGLLGLDPENNLSRYLQTIRKFPMLAPDEEFMLAQNYRESGDPDAAHRLVSSHLRLVAKIAMGYRGYGLPMGEVISEGNVGLMQAVKRFDPDRGFRLATYAMWWIRASIQEYILHSWSLVKMGTTAAQKKLFFNLRRMKGQLQLMEDGDLPHESVTEIATKLSVPEQDVINMNRRLGGPDHSLNAPVRIDGEGEWQDWLVDEVPDQEHRLAEHEEMSQRRDLLSRAMETLNDRERHILTERRLSEEPMTLEDLSHQYSIQPRARAPDRGPRLRKAAKVDEARHADRSGRGRRTRQWVGPGSVTRSAAWLRPLDTRIDSFASTVTVPALEILPALRAVRMTRLR